MHVRRHFEFFRLNFALNSRPWDIYRGESPLITAAIHDGHDIGRPARPWLALDDETRLREEDPFTGRLAEISDTRVIVHRSRFEVDLNRPREKAVYLRPEDAWGLRVWKDDLPPDVVGYALEEYDRFNADLFALLEEWRKRFGAFVLYDLHTYNHRRSGPDAPPADPGANPEVNVGTGTLDGRFQRVAERFIELMSAGDYMGRRLDVRENVKFRGGDFSRRIHERFPGAACVLAIEFKKIFMDEWTGEVRREALRSLQRVLSGTVEGVLKALREEG